MAFESEYLQVAHSIGMLSCLV